MPQTQLLNSFLSGIYIFFLTLSCPYRWSWSSALLTSSSWDCFLLLLAAICSPLKCLLRIRWILWMLIGHKWRKGPVSDCMELIEWVSASVQSSEMRSARISQERTWFVLTRVILLSPTHTYVLSPTHTFVSSMKVLHYKICLIGYFYFYFNEAVSLLLPKIQRHFFENR